MNLGCWRTWVASVVGGRSCLRAAARTGGRILRDDDWLAQTKEVEMTDRQPTADAGGRPHAAGVGVVWHDGDLYFTSGPGTRMEWPAQVDDDHRPAPGGALCPRPSI